MVDASASPLLSVRGLRVALEGDDGWLNAVDGVDFHVDAGETLGLVGESGCGKTTTGLALMRLTPKSARLDGRVTFAGRSVLELSNAQMRALRGGEISMVLQDPMVSLNPVLTIGDQIAEAVRAHHRNLDAGELRAAVAEWLSRVHIPSPERWLGAYPHELSGGMKQRVVGAIAAAGRPRLLIADEPTTSLDVTVQAGYLRLLRELQVELGMSLLFITHDFGVVAAVCDRVAVMYAGRIVETAPVRRLLRAPGHWYTAALIGGIPAMTQRVRRLASIPGSPPSLAERPPGCPFAPRCSNARPRCTAEAPPAADLGDGHHVLCWYPRDPAGACAPAPPGAVS